MVQPKPAARRGKGRAHKPKKAEAKNQDVAPNLHSTIPVGLQQACLDIFFAAIRPSDENASILQEVKGHLYNRDFAAAFGKEEYLRVYAGRWSPSRALGYLQILHDVQDHIRPPGSAVDLFRVVCLGGGAGAEVVAFGAWLSTLDAEIKLSACFVDIAAWSTVVDILHERLLNPRVLSEYASAAAKETNTALLSLGEYAASFLQQDALVWPDTDLLSTINKDTNLATLLFTLNELYTTSMTKTQHFLAQLTVALSPGAHLLVVDSPGSYSTIQTNEAEKKYPMQWLLDYTLLNESRAVRAADPGPAPKWAKVLSEDSKWFRLPVGLHYPIELENMRYQIHLYRRLSDGLNRQPYLSTSTNQTLAGFTLFHATPTTPGTIFDQKAHLLMPDHMLDVRIVAQEAETSLGVATAVELDHLGVGVGVMLCWSG
ncbi:hypothetical protein LTR78_006743 [Recurvomyces mirabilis]|uniref:25S rRNA (Uridine(2843)-N(3))-methyltransferase n=1 Tax=Recurvomyces mirabilis TaxID=574656 RepID=A0AAE1BZX2_9PEZI|nr:hypothetical protein LTR78_006743 [Recurvomyces mirabilis]KAK5151368.1 hypothetical protein LTS14_009211 [Recurvomyces mirabilis]